MTRKDIDRKYTEIVADLLGKGYQIHTASMSGCQGEVAHIDLTDGSEILRVLMTDELRRTREYFGHTITIRVGKAAGVAPTGCKIWNAHLDTRFEIEYVKLTDDYYTTAEDGCRGHQIKVARYKARTRSNRREMGDAFKSPVLRWLKRTQKGFKSASLRDIESVTRVEWMDWDVPTGELYGYEIKAKGKTYTLKFPRP